MKQHWKDNGEVWIDRECIEACWNKIFGFIRISHLNHHLISYGLASLNDHILLGDDQTKAKSHLLDLVSSAGPHGPYLFYMCLLESHVDARGHAEAAVILRKTGSKNNLFFPFIVHFNA